MYLVGTYNDINWSEEHTSVLGEKWSVYGFRDKSVHKSAIFTEQGLDGRYVLRIVETKRYILKIESDDRSLAELPRFQNEGNSFLKCDKDKDSVSFQFVNYLGRSKIAFGHDGNIEFLQFEVIPDKMNYEEDYIGLTEALAQRCSQLLLEYSGATSNIYGQSGKDGETPLEQFIFLRQFCYSHNLQGLFEAIKRSPDRILVRQEELKPLGYGRPSKKFYTHPFSGSKGWGRIGGSTDAGQYMPQEVEVTYKRDSLDTPANRFVKFALNKFDAVCVDLIEILESASQPKQAECLSEAKAIHTMLERIFRDHFFDEVGTLDIMPQNNQVLQKREGYSQIFSAYSMIDLALQLDWKGKDAAYDGESKNVALLYEYWLFFELFEIIRSVDGCEAVETKEDPFLIIDEGVTILLEQGRKSCQSFAVKRLKMKVNLYYNRTFSPKEFYTTAYEGSYSRPFRPDYTIAIYPDSFVKGQYNGEEEAVQSGAVSYVHFDAKYRVSDLTALIGRSDALSENDEDILEDKTGSVINTYKRGDLLKMHTYNDAIRRTAGSYILYPGSDAVRERCRLFSLYDEILPGVGAFAIRPGIDEQSEKELRMFIIRLLESKAAYYSRWNRIRYYTEMVLKEPSADSCRNHYNAGMSGKERSGYRDRVEKEMCILGYIRADSDDDYYYFLKNSNLLKRGEEFLFYFYAIRDKDVYSHHKDIFKATDFRFYANRIDESGTYRLEPVLCKVLSNELLSRTELVERLGRAGYRTDESKHHADFYYVLLVRVEEDDLSCDEVKISDINALNGNDTFSPHSPKVVCY